MIEARIKSLEAKLSNAQVIDVSTIHSDSIKFGAYVEIMDEDTEVVQKFQIVGSDEADIKAGLLPITSPLARALIGRREDDYVNVSTPSGLKSYTVLSVNYGSLED